MLEVRVDDAPELGLELLVLLVRLSLGLGVGIGLEPSRHGVTVRALPTQGQGSSLPPQGEGWSPPARALPPRGEGSSFPARLARRAAVRLVGVGAPGPDVEHAVLRGVPPLPRREGDCGQPTHHRIQLVPAVTLRERARGLG